MELSLSLGGGLAFNITEANSNGRFSHSVMEGDGAAAGSSPVSAASSFEMTNKRSLSGKEGEEIGQNDCRKKLRLSKDQSAFLEESYKEHNTLSPKQKVARQVEVWFQNRRARTKLKQTEVDCEYLKRRRETLSEQNRRLEKELQDLRALHTSNPLFCLQSPATTLTMCPSCEAQATTTGAKPPKAVTYLPQVLESRPLPAPPHHGEIPVSSGRLK